MFTPETYGITRNFDRSNSAPDNFTNPNGASTSGPSSLTGREREVIERIGNGLRNRAITARMGVSEKTVQNHLTSICCKLGVNDRLELAVLSRRSDLL